MLTCSGLADGVLRDRCGAAEEIEYRGGFMTINKTRGWLYLIAKLLGDVQAVQKGRVGKRILRRIAGKLTGRGLGKLFR
jgi:hypothetical protein